MVEPVLPARPAHAAPCLLVVDDSEDHRLLIERWLTQAGWRVQLARSGEEALELLSGVDLVLLDYRLPGMTGLQTLEQIRARNGPSVVMVTGMGSESVAVEAMRAGALDYLVKDHAYLQTLPQHVERAWQHHDLRRRAAELQRLALLVTSAAGRDEMLSAIVDGTRQVMRADACSLHVAHGTDMHLEAATGDPALVLAAAATATLQELTTATAPDPGGAGVVTDRLLLPVPGPSGEPLGLLAVATAQPVPYSLEELDLARTFASFAGISLANLHRLELEQELVVELQSMLDVRQQFVAHVSHELRTPLTCVQGFASTLSDHFDTLDPEQQRLFLSKIVDHSRELGEKVEQLLDFANIESGRKVGRIEAVDLETEVRAAMASLAPLAERRTITIQGQAITVQADPALLRATIRNLVSNAIKYSDQATEVVISLAQSGVTGPARVDVIDHGVGLSRAELAQVFDPFWRAPAVSMGAVRGTGIGLTLVREYVRALGGEVGVESEPGLGSTFWFTVPAMATTKDAAPV